MDLPIILVIFFNCPQNSSLYYGFCLPMKGTSFASLGVTPLRSTVVLNLKCMIAPVCHVKIYAKERSTDSCCHPFPMVPKLFSAFLTFIYDYGGLILLREGQQHHHTSWLFQVCACSAHVSRLWGKSVANLQNVLQ